MTPRLQRSGRVLEQWSGKRWPHHDFLYAGGKSEVALAKLDRTANDPGDILFRFFEVTPRWSVSTTGWVEITQVCIPGQDEKVKLIVRQRNGIQGKGSTNSRRNSGGPVIPFEGAELGLATGAFGISAGGACPKMRSCCG